MQPRKRRAKASPPSDHDLNPRSEPALDFRDRDLADMTPDDYSAIGFMCGLEVHQQLLTRSKLFCRCPAGMRATRVDAEVLRHMRPTLSEMGEYDGTALMEFKTRKEIVYLLERGSVCTYEMDDTPPFEIDEEAVRVALEISRLFDLNLVSELQVMRKQYLDGSIPTGFQRTAMIGLGGAIPFRTSELGSGRELRIRQLTLEEDSCREVSDIGHRIVFRTDRLGMPLIETVTEPELLTPHDVQAGGRLLASVVRASGKVRRGAGAARQDVNVSVAGGRRVEIKGVDNHRGLPRLVHIEAFRQLNLLRIRDALRSRGLTPDMFAIPEDRAAWESEGVADVRSILRRSDYEPVRDALERGEIIVGVRLRGLGDLLRHRTQPGVTFARELADRVRVIACPTARPFMIGSHVVDHGLSSRTWRQVRSAVGAAADDGIVVLWGSEEDVDTGVREALERAAEALVGVPSETRQAYADGTNGFERILPGAERMYPDTDTPPLPIPDEWVDAIELCERPWERADRYRTLGLTARAAALLAEAPYNDLFDRLAPKTSTTARRLAAALEKRLVRFWRDTGTRELPDGDRIQPLVDALDAEQLRPEAFEAVFDRILRREAEPSEAIAVHTPDGEDATRLDRLIAEAAGMRTQLPHDPLDDGATLRWALGRVMPTMLGKIDPATARERIVTAWELSP